MEVSFKFAFVLVLLAFLSTFRARSNDVDDNYNINKLRMFLKNSVFQVEIAMEAVKEARTGSIGVRNNADLIDCEVILDSAKHLMVSSMEELQGSSLNLKSYVTCGEGISSGVLKRRIQPQLEELVSRARMALAIFVTIKPERDVDEHNAHGSWLTDLEKELQHTPSVS